MGLAGLMRGKLTAAADLETYESRCANWHWEIVALEDHTFYGIIMYGLRRKHAQANGKDSDF